MGELVLQSFKSHILERNRQLRIWLPSDYSPTLGPYPVLWQQDGQMAFTERDQILPYGSWGIDEWVDKLAAGGVIRAPIVVAVDNSPKRLKEYNPLTDEYLKYREFFHEELIPWIRSEYMVSADPEDNFVMGSSLGGLVSFGLAFDNPEIFGAAACLSPWFELDDCHYVREVLRHASKKPPLRIYLDSGIRDWRGLDDGHRGMLLARKELLRLGFEEGDDLEVFVDTWLPTKDDLKKSKVKITHYGQQLDNHHTEYIWNRRLRRPLEFLLG